MTWIRVETEAGLATETSNRPEAMNALSRALRAQLVEALRTLQRDEHIGALILMRSRDHSRSLDRGRRLRSLRAIQERGREPSR